LTDGITLPRLSGNDKQSLKPREASYLAQAAAVVNGVVRCLLDHPPSRMMTGA